MWLPNGNMKVLCQHSFKSNSYVPASFQLCIDLCHCRKIAGVTLNISSGSVLLVHPSKSSQCDSVTVCTVPES